MGCRRVGVPDARCVLPLAHRVTQAARDAYLQSWVHRTARFQDALQDPVPLRETQWLGTHNSEHLIDAAGYWTETADRWEDVFLSATPTPQNTPP